MSFMYRGITIEPSDNGYKIGCFSYDSATDAKNAADIHADKLAASYRESMQRVLDAPSINNGHYQRQLEQIKNYQALIDKYSVDNA